jgi:hypothetical protein
MSMLALSTQAVRQSPGILNFCKDGVLTWKECFCDNVLNNATTLQSNSSCSMACTGNSAQVCGGPDLITVYYANAPAPQGPQTNPGPAGWTSAGCWADGSSKALANQVQVPGGGTNMTIVECTSACSAAGYKLAGVEYASKSHYHIMSYMYKSSC